jgi:uncharacterized protein
MDIESGDYIWDYFKEKANIAKHGIDFTCAAKVFKDPRKKLYSDSSHSAKEERLFCIGKVGNKIITVRFTYRHGKIRIFGAGLWRKGKAYYEKE